MQETAEEIILLLYRRVAGEEFEREESVALDAWLASDPHHERLLNELMDEPRMEQEVKALIAIDEEAALKKLHAEIAFERKPQLLYRAWFRYAAVAAIIVLLSFSIYFLLRNPVSGGR